MSGIFNVSDITGAAQVLYDTTKETVLMRLQGCEASFLDVEFRYVVAEFLKRSLVYRKQVRLPITFNMGTYRLPLQSFESVVALMAARWDGGTDLLKLGQAVNFQGGAFDSGETRRVGMIDHQRVRFYPIPDTNGVVDFDVAITINPDINAPLPDVLVPYQDVLMAGVLARMMSIPDKPYSNAQLASFHQREFTTQTIQARREHEGGRSYGSIRVRPIRFGR